VVVALAHGEAGDTRKDHRQQLFQGFPLLAGATAAQRFPVLGSDP
jgi:hypothetical protein